MLSRIRTFLFLLGFIAVGCGEVTMAEPGPDCDLYIAYVDELQKPDLSGSMLTDWVLVNKTGSDVEIADIHMENAGTDPSVPVDVWRFRDPEWRTDPLLTDHAMSLITDVQVYRILEPYVTVTEWRMQPWIDVTAYSVAEETNAFVFAADLIYQERKASVRVDFYAEPGAISPTGPYVPLSATVSCFE